MKLALFSHNILEVHINKLQTFFDKPLKEVKFLYITTSTNYKPYQPDWSVESENKWREIFPLLRSFDFERAYKVDNEFNFEEYLSQFEFIFFSGGNTHILSYWMKKTGSDLIIKRLVNTNKIVYGGESAGAIYTYKNLEYYKELDEPEKAPEPIDEALDLVDFAVIPHWQVPEYQTALSNIKSKFDQKGIKTYTITNDQALFLDENIISII